MTAFWVALVLMLSAVGSLLWALPSRFEQRQARMRESAMRSGLSLTTLNISDQSERGRINRSRRLVTAYRLRCSAEVMHHWPQCLLLRTTSGGAYGLPEHWCWAEQPVVFSSAQSRTLHLYLNSLPAWVEAWGITPEGVVAVIEERDGEARIAELQSLLMNWRNGLDEQNLSTHIKR